MSLRRMVSIVMFMFAVTAWATTVSAQWRELGSKEVDDRADHDTINVTGMKGDLRKIRIAVSDAPVRFYRVTLTYGNGTKQDIPLRSIIRAGRESRVIDLQGNERVIRKVEFWYEAASLGRRKARVTLWGRD